jgi:putative integral membrane protein (TIGR02587 family)
VPTRASGHGRAASRASEPVPLFGLLRGYARGFAGGLLFSLPLLYTMEVWWAGFLAEPWRLLALLAFTFLLLLGYNRFAGFRRDSTWGEVAVDSLDELGLGTLIAALLLLLIGQIGPGVGFDETVGKVVVEAAVVAVGFSVGKAQLGGGRLGDRDVGSDAPRGRFPAVLGQAVVALCGAVLLAANIGPTEEIVQIAVASGPLRLLVLVLLSLLLTGAMLFFTEVRSTHHLAGVRGSADVLLEISITYAVALLASAAILSFFGRYRGVALDVCVAETVVLGLPAALGASTGRLLLQDR